MDRPGRRWLAHHQLPAPGDHRSNGTNLRFTADDTKDAVISNLPGNRIEYTHTGLKNLTPYYYSIRALNDADGDRRPGEHPDDANAQSNQIAERSLLVGFLLWKRQPLQERRGHLRSRTPQRIAQQKTQTQTKKARSTSCGPLCPQKTKVPCRLLATMFSTSALTVTESTTGVTQPSIARARPRVLQYVHTGREGGSTYEYRVRAVNGNGDSGWSDAVASIDIDTRGPEAPVLTATAVGSTEIVLQWNVPETNGTVIDGYEIQQWNPAD